MFSGRLIVAQACAGLICFQSPNIVAQSTWINPASGLWRQSANWSAGVPTSKTGLTLITNANTKTVTIDGATAASNLTIGRLVLSAPATQTNTLLLDGLTVSKPFISLSSVTLNSGGAVVVNNSKFVVDGNSGGNLTLGGGELTLLSGELVLTNFARGRVGLEKAGTLNVSGGTFHSYDDLLIGAISGGNGIVNLSGGQLDVDLNVVLGDDPATVGTINMSGGTLVATNDTLITRIGDDGDGVATISSGSAYFSDVSVARSIGSHGTFNITGGTVQTKDLSVGRFEGATGVVNISGGELRIPLDSLLIGREGAGSVQISGGLILATNIEIATNSTASGILSLDGGRLVSKTTLSVGAVGGGSAQVTMKAGSLEATNSSATGQIIVHKGTFGLEGGMVWTDRLYVTNSSGAFQFKDGTLHTGNTKIANNAPFIVGDGIHPALLRLEGGTHAFANGLVISQNATVSGCGQIIGAIENHGVLSTNCGGAIVPPSITTAAMNGNTFSFQFQTETGVSYTVEYKNSLPDAGWTTLKTVPGTGGVVFVSDANNGGTRFYRVAAQ